MTDKIISILKLILNVQEYSRIECFEDCAPVKVRIDLHGFKMKQVKRLLCNIIASIREPFELDVIHGYRHGDAIKCYIANDLNNSRIKEKQTLIYNPGETIIKIA